MVLNSRGTLVTEGKTAGLRPSVLFNAFAMVGSTKFTSSCHRPISGAFGGANGATKVKRCRETLVSWAYTFEHIGRVDREFYWRFLPFWGGGEGLHFKQYCMYGQRMTKVYYYCMRVYVQVYIRLCLISTSSLQLQLSAPWSLESWTPLCSASTSQE